MENKKLFNPDLGTMACVIEKVHNCADCPIRRLAIEQPQSAFARIHTWHAAWWPGWKAHQARACAISDSAQTQA
jgi:hypothetical protein